MQTFHEMTNTIWVITDRLRDQYKPTEYRKVILPFTLLRRLECESAAPKRKPLTKSDEFTDSAQLQTDYLSNSSSVNFSNLHAENFQEYLDGFSPKVKEMFHSFGVLEQVKRLSEGKLLDGILQQFTKLEMQPSKVTKPEMGRIFDELIYLSLSQGEVVTDEPYTPTDVIRLMTHLLFQGGPQGNVLYDPLCGTGERLATAQAYVKEKRLALHSKVKGQTADSEWYAICQAVRLLKGEDLESIQLGHVLVEDKWRDEKFDYMLAHPAFDWDWKHIQKEIIQEQEQSGRVSAGLPQIYDGSLLFLQHMISKMKPAEQGGSRIAILFNGSSLQAGAAESGESEIRRWIIENDWLEAIVALPDQLFSHTGVSTYIWLLSNNKHVSRKGKVQLINAVECYQELKVSVGLKKRELAAPQIAEIARLYKEFAVNQQCRILENKELGYRRITIERPLRLNFCISDERIRYVEEHPTFQELVKPRMAGEVGEKEVAEGKETQKQLLDLLRRLESDYIYKNRDEFNMAIKKAFIQHDITVSAPLQQALLASLSERDETATVCLDSRARPEADADYRDYEFVPFQMEPQTYFESRVKPHLPDAWIDDKKTQVGYEIPFAKYFYESKPSRSLEEIDREIGELEMEIASLLAGVRG